MRPFSSARYNTVRPATFNPALGVLACKRTTRTDDVVVRGHPSKWSNVGTVNFSSVICSLCAPVVTIIETHTVNERRIVGDAVDSGRFNVYLVLDRP